MTDKLQPLFDDEREAVKRYRAQYGRFWRKCLADHWANEFLNPPSDRRDAPILRGIRNHPRQNLQWLWSKQANKDAK